MPQRGAAAAAAAADDIGGVAVGGFPLPPSDLVDVVRCLGLERPFVFAHSVHATLALLAEAMAPGLWGAAYLFEPVACVTAAQARPPPRLPTAARLLRLCEPRRGSARSERSCRTLWMDVAASRSSAP